MRKRLTALLLALVMCLSLVPTVAFADEPDGQVRVIVENTTFTEATEDSEDVEPAWSGTLVNEWVNITDDSTMMSCVVAALTAKGYTQKGAEDDYISEINGLAAFDGGSMSGWMGTLNDWFTNEGFGAFTAANGKLSAGDEIRLMYSLDYGEDCGGSWSNTDKTVKSVTFSAGTLDKEFASGTYSYTLTVPAGTTAVTVTPTASNKNYQVRTCVGTTEYKRTAAVPVENGTVITVTCGDKSWPTMNDNEGDAQTYTFTVSKPVPAESIALNKSELTLDKGDSETLTATVTPDGATDTVAWSSSDAAIATVDNTGKVTAVAAGTATITATAGTKTATCAVTVEQPTENTVTVNVAPKTANADFFKGANAETALAASAVEDKGQVKVGSYTYHQYVLTVPAGVYSYRGTEGDVALGGEQFTVTEKEGQSLNLLRANIRYNGASLNQEGDYSFTLKNGENEVAYGEPYVSSNIRYTPTLLIAGVAHTGTVTLNEKWEDEFYLTGTPAGSFSNTPSKTASSAASINLPISAYKIIKLTAPKDATTTFYKQDANYVVESVAPDSSAENEDGTVTYLFKGTAAHSNYQFRSMMSDKVTQAGYLADGDNITVTFPTDRTPADTGSTLAYDDNSVLLNINEKNKLNLAVGDTFKLRAFRAAWEIINSTTANQMIEPDFHYTVLSGSDVISIAPTTECSNSKFPNAKNGNATGNWMNVKALKAGTAIVAVYYDAIDVYGANPSNATGITTFGATDPARYGIFAVTVGEDKNLSWNPVSHDGDWDAEFDTVYYNGDNGVFTFRPTETVTGVTVQNVLGTTLGNAKPVAVSADGSYAVPVTTGANIIAVTTAEGTDYQVVRAEKISYTITNTTTKESAVNAAPAIKTGDSVTISFDKLDMPIPKMSGIYNPGYLSTAKTAYELNGSMLLTSAGTQYDFASNMAKNSVTFTAHVAGENSLKGYISLSSMGDPFGNHRNISDDGKPVNMNAGEVFGDFGILPDITFHVTDSGETASYEDATKITSISVVAGLNTYNMAFNWNKLQDTEAAWNKTAAQVSSFGLIAKVAAKDYNNTITFRYWYEGEEVHSVKLSSGITTTINAADFPLNPDKIMHLQVEIKPLDETLGDPVVYNYLAFPGSSSNALHYIHPFIKSLSAKVGEETVALPINTVDTDYTLEVGGADKISLNAVQLVGLYNTANTGDCSDQVTLTKMSRGAAVGESTTVLEKGLANNPNRSWKAEDIDIADVDALELKVTSYVDASVSRTYHIDLMRTGLVVEKIAAIGTVTLESKSAIDAARAAYDALPDAEKAKVTNYAVLTAAESAYATLKADKDAVDAVIASINGIGTVTLDSKGKIEAARTAYDALPDAEKAKVTNYSVLTAAESAYATLKADKDAVDAVIASINGIGTVTLDSKGKIDAARTAYDALTDELKAKVTNYSALTAAESAYTNIARTKANDIYTAVGNSLLANAEKSTPVVNSIGGEWMILGLARSGKLTDEVAKAYYANVTKTVEDCGGVLDKRKYTEYSRVVLALTAADFDATNVAGYDLTAPLTNFDKTVWQGNNGTAFGLIALNSHGYHGDNTAIRQQYVNELLNKQLENGGWYITSGSADLDMTAMAIQALAPYCDTDASVKAAVDKALAFLSEKQGADGDYGSSETCAQVVVALSALGIDAATDSRFVKNGTSVLEALCSYYAEDATYGKGFAHVKESNGSYAGGAYNGMATEQGYYALTAYQRFKGVQTALYDMSDVCAGQHSYGDWTVTKAASCTENGSRSRTCSACGKTETETITAPGHKMSGTAAKAPTCTAGGNNEYFTCSVCGKVFKDAGGKQETTAAAEMLPALGHNWANATCIAPKTCRTCGLTEGTSVAHSYNDKGVCTVCGGKNPVGDVKPENVKPSADNDTIVTDGSGLVIKSNSTVDDAKLNEIKDALTGGSVTMEIGASTTIEKADDGGVAALTAMAGSNALTGEQKAEINKLNDAVQAVRSNSAKKNAQVETVLDICAKLKDTDNNDVADLVELHEPIIVTIPVSDELYTSLQGRKIAVLRSHTDAAGAVTTAELPAEWGGKAGSRYVKFASDRFSTFALISYETVSHGSGHSSTAPTKSFATDLSGITAVYVDGVKLDSKYYTVSGTTVTLSESFLKTLKDGKHTFKAENATHIATGTFRTSGGSATSPRTADSGIALYAAMSVMSLMGMGWVGKRRGE